ncbi:NUDIX hydrolase [Sediminibacterium sp. C3]|uniref:NUDIX hydrolase n=1 Tax=Sediminibacterium sp. C3 TaxID=1267211 RepID=UPI0003FF99EC|nr:NUDIX hydrolase [Sediminibacterium sp. C3]
MDYNSRKWVLLESKEVYKKKWLTVLEDRCQLPDGSVIDPYFTISVPDFCNIIMVTPNEEVVLVRQYRHAAGIVSLELPGGIIEPGEDPAFAAKREMEEETGFQTQEFEFLYKIHPNPPLEKNQAYFFLAKNVVPTGTVALDPFEDIELVFLQREAFMQKLLQHEFQHGIQLSAMYAAAIQLGWIKA